MAQHAKLMPASGAPNWLTCTGAPAMQFDIPNTSNSYADEGTAAHFLGALALETATHPATFIGKTIIVGSSEANEFDGAFFAGAPAIPVDFVIREKFDVDVDMAGRVNTYVQAVQKAAVGGTLMVERRLPLEPVTGEEGAFGTADAVIIRGGTLEVHDLKYGRGAVAAEHNKQLMLYLLAAIDEYGLLEDFTNYKVVIHQPKLSVHPLEWEPTQDEVDAFRRQVADVSAAVMLAFKHRVNWIGKDQSYLTRSDDGCLWCRAKATCPEYAAQVLEVVETVAPSVEEFPDLTADDIKDTTQRWNHVELSEMMALTDNREEFIKAVRARVDEQLHAGVAVPGWKLVAGKKGNRQWRDEKTAEETLKGMRLKQEEMYSFNVISPTSAEKIFGEKGSDPSVRRWNKLKELIVQKDGKPHVAPESDPRPALDKSAGLEDETGGDLC